MVVDTSALLAIVLNESERSLFEDLVLRTPTVVMSVIAVVEATIVLFGKRRDPEVERLDDVLATLRINVREVDLAQGALAQRERSNNMAGAVMPRR